MIKPRLLIVSYWFPPFQTIGAERLRSFAQHLSANGWEIAVITVNDSLSAFSGHRTVSLDESLEVCRLNGFSWSELIKRGLKGRVKGNTAESSSVDKTSSWWKRLAFRLYNDYVCFPDECWPWQFFGRRKAIRFANEFCPDIILSSAMPFSSHVLAHAIQRATGATWVADYRDYWTGHPFRQRSERAEKRAKRYEGKIISSAALILSVSEPYAQTLSRVLNKPSEVIYNGFEPRDFDGRSSSKDNVFRICYTGMIYGNLQAPEIFMEGLQLFVRSIAEQPETVCFHYRGPNCNQVKQLAKTFNIDSVCDIQPSVPRSEALTLQMTSDLLLFLTFKVDGWLSGKLMEYLGTPNPILAVGVQEPESERLLIETKHGVQSNSAKDVSKQLEAFYSAKKRETSNHVEPMHTFSREAQAKKMEQSLEDLLG